MMHTLILLILLTYYDIIASLVAGIRRINTQEGNTVALQPQIPKTKSDDMLLWSFNPDNTHSKSVIVKSQMLSGKITTEYKGSFKDQLVLERNTGSLTIRNITTSLSGRYSLQIIGDDGSISDRHFQCFVYAPASAPNISIGYSHTTTTARSRTGSKSSFSARCQVICSVKNDREASLSWFRGNEMLNQTSSHDFSITLSLPLEIDDQDTRIYRCVSSNPVSNYTSQLNIPKVCPYNNQDESIHPLYIAFPLVCLSVIAVVVIGLIIHLKRKRENNECTGHTAEDPQYADLRHNTHRPVNIENQDVLQETAQTCETIYSGIMPMR